MPRKWALKNNLRKGDELDVTEEADNLIISPDNNLSRIEKAEIDVSNLDMMIARVIHALYKRGVDELKVNFNDASLVATVQQAIGKEAVGFEILEQGRNYCLIKNVSSSLEGFDPLLRRTFLLLIKMAEECHDALKNGQFDLLKDIAFLEEANNRFTTFCRRMLNKRGHPKYAKVGPIYYIIEELENIADQYKFLCNSFYEVKDKKISFSQESLDFSEQVNDILKEFYQLFYKFDQKKLVKIKKLRKQMVKDVFKRMEKCDSFYDTLLLHHNAVIMQKIFCLTGPYLILAL